MFMLFTVASYFKPFARVRNHIFECNTKYILRIIDIELQFAESNDIIIENTTVSYQFNNWLSGDNICHLVALEKNYFYPG